LRDRVATGVDGTAHRGQNPDTDVRYGTRS
jgi:hypothetical protein